MKLAGIFASITTPFDHNGDIYRVKIEHNLSRWNTTSLAGYVVGASAGEGALLAHDEKIAVWELSAKHAGAGRTLIADVSVEGVREAAELAKSAAEAGYAAVCARVPSHYGRLVQGAESQMQFFRALADRSPVPVIVVDEETPAGDDLSADAVVKLAGHPNIAGVVLTGRPVAGVKAILKSARPDFQVLAGSAGDLWQALKDGAHGAALPFAAAAPYAAIAVWEAFRTREYEAGADWQQRIARPASLVTDVYGIAGLKHAMDLNGYYGGPARLPLLPVPAEARTEIARAFEGFSGKT
jgi:4-hydroxy-2-oxoglutarate aldolase